MSDESRGRPPKTAQRGADRDGEPGQGSRPPLPRPTRPPPSDAYPAARSAPPASPSHRDHGLTQRDVEGREETLLEVVRLLPDVLFRCYKGDDGRIYWSLNEGGLAEAFHLTTDEIQGKTLEDLFPGGASPALKQHFEDAFRGEPTVFTNEMDGRHFRHFPQPVRDVEGNVVEVVGFIADVTQLVETQQELEAKNQELEGFAHTVSHDLQGPLSAARNLLYVLRRRSTERGGPTQKEDIDALVERIDGMLQRMSMTTDSLLRLAGAGRGQPDRVPVDVTEAVQDIIADQAAAHPERIIVWDVEKSMRTEADAVWLRVALENLISNAVKFTRREPQARIRIASTRRDGRLWFSVEDNGPGFAAADARRIFDAFHRLDSEPPGFGIGLATVKRIIEAHGGDIFAEPRDEGGARFLLTFDEA